MDTLDLYNGNIEKKTLKTFNLAMVCFALILSPQLFSVPILAENLLIAQAPVPTTRINTQAIYENILNEISPEVRARNFDEKIKAAFPNSSIRTITTGVKHIKLIRYYDGKPVRINAVAIDRKLASDFELKPALSSTSNNLHNKRTITTIAKNTNSIVALNGTFFKPQTGVPLGTLMIDKKFYTGPVYNRVAIGIFEDGFDVRRIEFNGTIKANNTRIKIDNINQPRMLSTYAIAYTTDWGKTAPASPKYGYQIAIKDNKLISHSSNSLEIPEGGYVIVAPFSTLKPLLDAKHIDVEIKTVPEWKGVQHIISGGPYLVKDSNVYVDMTDEKLGAIGGKNPRSAVGYTRDNTFIMVAVDGREGQSVGMTLMQLARFMKSVGCVNAINLDGGGSTVMYVNGQIVNNPAFKGGIAISNALVLSKKGES